MRQAGDRVLHYVPFSLYATLDWVASAIEGMLNSANTLIGNLATES